MTSFVIESPTICHKFHNQLMPKSSQQMRPLVASCQINMIFPTQMANYFEHWVGMKWSKFPNKLIMFTALCLRRNVKKKKSELKRLRDGQTKGGQLCREWFSIQQIPFIRLITIFHINDSIHMLTVEMASLKHNRKIAKSLRIYFINMYIYIFFFS